MRLSPSGEKVTRGTGVFKHLWLLVKITDFAAIPQILLVSKSLFSIQNGYRALLILLILHLLILLPDRTWLKL